MSTNQLTRCERHPAEMVGLSCGECDRPICTVCMTLTGEGPRCPDCMARLNAGFAPAATVQGVVLPAGEEVARTDAAREAYYATEKTIFCARHPQTETGLRCGRCDTPICPRCMVHSSVGIRCPECAANPQRTVGARVELEAAAARGQLPPRDTGFRNYWHKNQAYQKVEVKHYVLAVLAGFGTALAVGLVWGLLMNGNLPRGFQGVVSSADLLGQLSNGTSAWTSLMSNAMRSGIHLIPEIALGVLVGEAIARATGNRVGPGLQLVAGLAVFFGIVVSAATVGTRLFRAATGTFPPVSSYLTEPVAAVFQQFSSGGLGILVFFAAGIAFAVMRLKR